MAQRNDDFHLRPRAREIPDYPVFTQENVTQIAKQGATLDQIISRLNTCDDNVKDIKRKLDDDVLPTIHVFNFLKWIIGIIIAVAIGTLVPDWLKKMRQPRIQT
jgi:hypothetical protein